MIDRSTMLVLAYPLQHVERFPRRCTRRSERRLCRESLEAARRRYEQNKSPENRGEYLRILKRFADLVIRK